MKNHLLPFVLLSFILLFSFPAEAQGLFDKLKDKVKEKTEQKTEEAIEEAIKDKEESEAPQEDPGGVSEEYEQSETPAAVPKDEFKSYSKYDFIPGEKLSYYEDFSSDNIGDFPPAWWTNKSGEVATTNLYPGKWFQLSEYGIYFMDGGFIFPENFTLEFDIIPVDIEDAGTASIELTLLKTLEDDPYPIGNVPGEGGVHLRFATRGGSHGIAGYSNYNFNANSEYTKEKGLLKMKEANHVSVWIQKTRVRVYLHGEKIFDMPKAFQPGLLLNQIRFWPDHYSNPMISNIRIAEAGADMRSKLITEGKLVTRGILFDVNSDKIKPESYGVLKEISKVLSDNPDVRVKILGHTDSDGSDEANLDLSKRRAAAVKNTLNLEFSIDASRMETDGKGESEPTDKNDTPGGKANNRRVEFIKL